MDDSTFKIMKSKRGRIIKNKVSSLNEQKMLNSCFGTDVCTDDDHTYLYRKKRPLRLESFANKEISKVKIKSESSSTNSNNLNETRENVLNENQNGDVYIFTDEETDVDEQDDAIDDRSYHEVANKVIVFNLNEKLEDYNYLEWSKSIKEQLKNNGLEDFLYNKPNLTDVKAIGLDKKIKESILNEISLSSKSILQSISKDSGREQDFVNKLWSTIEEEFYLKYVSKIDSNINYITRTDVKAISEIKCHINRFKNCVKELIAVDMSFTNKILIRLFLHTLSTHLPVFKEGIENGVKAQGLNFLQCLNYCSSQASFIINLKHSNENIELLPNQINQ